MHVDRQLVIEELANTITHGIGLVFSVAGLAVLLALSISKGSRIHCIAFGIYGATLILVYAASTLYHSIQKAHIKHIFRAADQVAIYLVIAGTYTPFMLINLRGFWGWTLLISVWTLSLFGIFFKVIFLEKYNGVSYALYVIIAWLAIIAIKPIMATVPIGGLEWIFGGGASYMIGLIFFAVNKIPFNHTIWHLFVMLGSGCHYIAVLYYVLPVNL